MQYYCKIFLGTHKESMNVILDSGSNLVWVPGKNCQNCRTYTNKYDPFLSNTSKISNEKVNITYAKGRVSGGIIEDSISFIKKHKAGSSELTDFRIVLVDKEENLTGTLSDGIVGMGIDMEGKSRNSLIYSLYETGVISTPQFTFYLSDSKKLSRLYLGNIYQNVYLRELKLDEDKEKENNKTTDKETITKSNTNIKYFFIFHIFMLI